MKMTPHLRVLATPWLQRRNGGTLWSTAAMAAILLAPGLVAACLSPQIALGLTLSAVLPLQGLWLVQFASLWRQNHPNAARLVPGHLRTLRESLVGLWLLLMTLMGLLPGAGLGWTVAAGASMLLTALLVRMPWLWIPVSFSPVAFGLGQRQASFLPLMEAWNDVSARMHWTPSAAAVLVLAWLLCQLLQDGGAAHYRSYAYGERMRKAMRTHGNSNFRLPPLGGRLGEAVTNFYRAPFLAWMRHLIARAAPTERSAMARAQLVLGAHWTGQLAGGVTFVVIGALSAGVGWFVFHQPLWKFRGEPAVGLMIGATSAALAPVMALRASLHNTRREQALLLLLPGMPRGAALNRALARGHLQRIVISWIPAMAVVLVLGIGTPMFWPGVAFGIGCLPVALLLLRDWSSVPPASVNAQAAPALLMVVLGLVAMGVYRRFEPSPLCLLGLLLAVLALGVWRWQRLPAYPQAFPAGRFAK